MLAMLKKITGFCFVLTMSMSVMAQRAGKALEEKNGKEHGDEPECSLYHLPATGL